MISSHLDWLAPPEADSGVLNNALATSSFSPTSFLNFTKKNTNKNPKTKIRTRDIVLRRSIMSRISKFNKLIRTYSLETGSQYELGLNLSQAARVWPILSLKSTFETRRTSSTTRFKPRFCLNLGQTRKS